MKDKVADLATQLQVDPSMMFSPWNLIRFPILYGIIGFVTGVILAWVYNLVAKGAGGIHLEIK